MLVSASIPPSCSFHSKPSRWGVRSFITFTTNAPAMCAALLPPSSPGAQTLLKLSFHFFFCYCIVFLPVTLVCFCSRHPAFDLSSSVSSVVSHSRRPPSPVSNTYIYIYISLYYFAVLSHTTLPHLTLDLCCCFVFSSAFALLLADSRMKIK